MLGLFRQKYKQLWHLMMIIMDDLQMPFSARIFYGIVIEFDDERAT